VHRFTRKAALFENAPLSVQQLLLNLVDGEHGLNETSLFAAESKHFVSR
jgi:hypothetical protein